MNQPTTKRFCFHADESFTDPDTGKFQIVRIDEDESGYRVDHGGWDTVEAAQAAVRLRNERLGLADEDVLEIRSSSMAKHFAENAEQLHSVWIDTATGTWGTNVHDLRLSLLSDSEVAELEDASDSDITQAGRENGVEVLDTTGLVWAEAHAVLKECVAEAFRNQDNGDRHTEADVAADIVRRLAVIYPGIGG